ncbi:hypothetical protein MTO96_036417 [Rhipicephalus appendiculatus]
MGDPGAGPSRRVDQPAVVDKSPEKAEKEAAWHEDYKEHSLFAHTFTTLHSTELGCSRANVIEYLRAADGGDQRKRRMSSRCTYDEEKGVACWAVGRLKEWTQLLGPPRNRAYPARHGTSSLSDP